MTRKSGDSQVFSLHQNTVTAVDQKTRRTKDKRSENQKIRIPEVSSSSRRTEHLNKKKENQKISENFCDSAVGRPPVPEVPYSTMIAHTITPFHSVPSRLGPRLSLSKMKRFDPRVSSIMENGESRGCGIIFIQ